MEKIMDFPFAAKMAHRSLPKQIQKQLRPSEAGAIETLIFTQNDEGESVIEIEARGRGLIFTWKPIQSPNPNAPEVTHCWSLTEEYDVEEQEEQEVRSNGRARMT
jgi:hypothetical protein